MLKPTLSLKILKRDKWICRYCGKDGLESVLTWHQTTVDHFDPKGGDNEENLVACCEYCNSLKGDRLFKTVEDAKAYLAKRKKELQEDFLKLKKEVRGHENP